MNHHNSPGPPPRVVPNSPLSTLSTWVSQLDNGFQERAIRNNTEPGQHHHHHNPNIFKVRQARSGNTSLAVNCRIDDDSLSMDSDQMPPLRRENSIASTCSWTSIETTSPIDGGCVLQSDNGVLLAPDRYDDELVCPFQVLNCNQTFSLLVDFKMHVFSHFRGFPPPSYAPCFICQRCYMQQPHDDLTLAWNEMLDHMAEDHYRGTQETVRFHPAIAVMRYMWNNNIISSGEFTRTQLVAPETRLSGAANARSLPELPTPPPARTPSAVRQHLEGQSTGSYNQPFTVTAGGRHHRRHADRLGLRNRVLTSAS